jgi:hypothetical protein
MAHKNHEKLYAHHKLERRVIGMRQAFLLFVKNFEHLALVLYRNLKKILFQFRNIEIALEESTNQQHLYHFQWQQKQM